MLNDLRLAIRALRRSPAFTAVAVLTLALGIGANTALFSVADAVLFKPLPYAEPERIVKIEAGPVSFTKTSITASRQMEQSPMFAGAGIYATGGLNVGADGAAERVRAAAVSAGFFQAMATAPMIGRTFTPAEAAAVERVAVISYGLWRRRFAERRELDQSLILNGKPYTVVGVMPPRYVFPDHSEVWVPPGTDSQITGGAFAPTGIARLNPGVTLPAALGEIERIKYRGQPKHPMDRDVVLTPLREELVGAVRPLFGIVSAAGLLVLLVACINTANLLLARIASREREISVRRALGASRARLVRYLLCESATLSILAGLVAVPTAVLTLSAVRVVLPPTLHGVADVAIDGRAALVTSLLCVACTVLFGLAPSLSVDGRSSSIVLRSGSATASPFWRRFRGTLVAAEVAAGLVLLAGAVTIVNTVGTLMKADVGARGENVVTLQLTLPIARYDTRAKVNEFLNRLDERLRRIAGVESAAGTSMMPGSREVGIGVPIKVEGLPEQKVESHALLVRTTPDYFRTMGIDLLAGRAFTAADGPDAPSVTIVSERVARAYGLEPSQLVGRRIPEAFQGKTTLSEIIGVVRDVRHRGPEGVPGAQLYRPFAQNPSFGTLYVAVKASNSSRAIVQDVRVAVATEDSSLPPYNVRTFEEIRASYVAERRFAMTIMLAFAVVTASLAAIGLYGVMSYLVQLRTREIGIRVALGATPGSVLRDTMTRGLWHAVGGVLAGAALAAALSRVFISKVAGLQHVDAATLAMAASSMLLLAAATTWLPARRASRVDAVQALRSE
jgi:putative ABC transport system permease protein